MLPIVRELHTLSLIGVPKIPPVTRATLILSVAALGASAFQRGVVASELQKDVLQVLQTYCFSCHDETARGGVNLEALSAKGTFWSEPKTWEKALNTVRDASMPPRSAQP